MATKPNFQKLDELFHDAKKYSKSEEYKNLILFCKKMRHLGPYNAMLANIQMPGAKFLLTADKWMQQGRSIKYSARPVVILLPFSPVDFVFDLSDTIAVNESLFNVSEDDILERIKNQFNPSRQYDIRKLQENLNHNLQLEGIAVEYAKMGTELAGGLCSVTPYHRYKVDILINSREKWYESALANYYIQLSQDLDEMGRFLSLLHELGHLYCHHISHPVPSSEDAWVERHPGKTVEEFEAESVSELVFDHFGFSTGSVTRSYLAGYLENNEYLPSGFSPETVFSASGKIIQMLERKFHFKEGLVYKNNDEFSNRILRKKNKAQKSKEKKSKIAAAQVQTLPFQDFE